LGGLEKLSPQEFCDFFGLGFQLIQIIFNNAYLKILKNFVSKARIIVNLTYKNPQMMAFVKLRVNI
jgi:hypothetical protein